MNLHTPENTATPPGQSAAFGLQPEFNLNPPPTPRHPMRVTKRSGAHEPIDVNKIVRAVTRCSEGIPDVDPMRVALKTIAGLYDGATTREVAPAICCDDRRHTPPVLLIGRGIGNLDTGEDVGRHGFGSRAHGYGPRCSSVRVCPNADAAAKHATFRLNAARVGAAGILDMA